MKFFCNKRKFTWKLFFTKKIESFFKVIFFSDAEEVTRDFLSVSKFNKDLQTSSENFWNKNFFLFGSGIKFLPFPDFWKFWLIEKKIFLINNHPTAILVGTLNFFYLPRSYHIWVCKSEILKFSFETKKSHIQEK